MKAGTDSTLVSWQRICVSQRRRLKENGHCGFSLEPVLYFLSIFSTVVGLEIWLSGDSVGISGLRVHCFCMKEGDDFREVTMCIMLYRYKSSVTSDTALQTTSTLYSKR